MPWNKIVIIGSPGAGKSTFARELGDILTIDVYHLDYYFWESGWHEKPRSDRIEIQKNLIQNQRWIIEGTYLSSSDERLDAADTIIFLDLPLLLCLYRVLKRRIKYHKKTRPDLPEGCPEKLRFVYLLKVLAFPERGRKLFFEKQSEVMKSHLHEERPKAFFWLRSRQEVKNFLQNPRGYEPSLPAFAKKGLPQALLPKDPMKGRALLGILLAGLTMLGAASPFAIFHPIPPWINFKSR